jgi:hypothetical protein
MDHAHIEIADPRAVLGPVEVRILSNEWNAKTYVRFVAAQTVDPEACRFYMRAKPRWHRPRLRSKGV